MKVYPSPLGDIHVGAVSDGLTKVIDHLHATAIFLLADENTATLCVPQLKSIADLHRLIVIPAGELHKNLDSCQNIWSYLLKERADRSSLVLNVGGGMICDLGGFAAACYQRGISFGHIPTSVLAIADAAIGGKTGINFEGYKNYIGRIQSPSFIWIDPSFIKTLPKREITNGFTEIVKHAIIGSRSLWNILLELEDLEKVDWVTIIEENTPIKQHIVEADPNEKGLRKILNFGHTFGHAIESYFMRSNHPLSHGEAITLGMLAESRIASEMGLLNQEDFHSIIMMIHRLLHPVGVTLPSIENLLPWIQGDKKNHEGHVRFSLPDKIGSCGWNIEVEPRIMEESLDWLSIQVEATFDRLNVE